MLRINCFAVLLLVCTGVEAVTTATDMGQASPYDAVTAHLTNDPKPLGSLPGFTRSVVTRNYALITPESRVFTAPLVGWTGTTGIVYISPAIGARFTMYTAIMNGDGQTDFAPKGIERLMYVLSGEVSLAYTENEKKNETILDGPGAYVYLPPDTVHLVRALSASTLLVIERFYDTSLGLRPYTVVGREQDLESKTVPDEDFLLKKLLPAEVPFDFNVHVMDFQPGEYLICKEVHFHEHGLLLLQGEGIYRLGNDWYPVTAGDVIWMGAFVPQWFGSLGKRPSRYILYKDIHRHPQLNSWHS